MQPAEKRRFKAKMKKLQQDLNQLEEKYEKLNASSDVSSEDVEFENKPLPAPVVLPQLEQEIQKGAIKQWHRLMF